MIATNFGYEVDEERKSVVLYGGEMGSDVVVEHIRRDCEASLRRLNTSVIDLFQFHVSAYPPEKAAAVRDVLEDLVSEGKIRFYGWSTGTPQGRVSLPRESTVWRFNTGYTSALRMYLKKCL